MSTFMNLSSSSSSSSEDEYSSSSDEDIKDKIHNSVYVDDEEEEEDDVDEFDDIDWEDGGDAAATPTHDNNNNINSNPNHDLSHQTYISSISSNTDHNNPSIMCHLKEDFLNTEEIRQRKNSSTTIHSGNDKKKEKRQRQRKRYNKIPISSLTTSSPQIKELLRNIQRAHILSLTSRLIFHSSLNYVQEYNGSCWMYAAATGTGDCDNEILNLAYSLIPMEFIDYSAQQYQQQQRYELNTKKEGKHSHYVLPNKMILHKFCTWFFQFINQISEGTKGRNNRSSSSFTNNICGNARRRKRNIGEKSTTSSTTAIKRKESSKKFKGNTRERDNYGYNYNNGFKRSSFGMKHKQESSISIAGTMIHELLEIFEYLSCVHDENNISPTISRMELSPLQKTLLLLCMTRSMGWRVRFVNAIDPVEQDLTVEHPLFSLGMKDVFHTIMNQNSKQKSKNSKKEKGAKKLELLSASATCDIDEIPQHDNGNDDENIEYPWVEIFTSLKERNDYTTNTNRSAQQQKHQSRWIHVDPNFEIIDDPLLVELIRGQKNRKGSPLKSKGMMIPVSYVVAVEHSNHLPHPQQPSNTKSTLISENQLRMPHLLSTRIVDVTPRYANKWSRTLRLRGATAKEVEKSEGKCSNKWWTSTIKKANKFFSSTSTTASSLTSPNRNEKKVRKELSPVIERNKHGNDILVLDDSSEDEKKACLIKEQSSDEDNEEANEFNSSKLHEAIPTSKTAFKNHPFYVIPSVLKNQEVLAPDAKKRVCGIFKGELVYKRSDVSTALPAKKWLYESRKVRASELSKPVKKIKARKKSVKKGFQALTSYGRDATKSQAEILASSVAFGDFEENDDKLHIYGRWQTDSWSPPYVGPNDEIPMNEHKNVELALINPGLVHLELHRISLVARKLEIPYAPCLLGFEGHGGNRTPTIRGIVVHEQNADLLREAHTEYESKTLEDAYKKKQEEIHRRWRRLINGVLTTERLKREYGNN